MVGFLLAVLHLIIDFILLLIMVASKSFYKYRNVHTTYVDGKSSISKGSFTEISLFNGATTFFGVIFIIILILSMFTVVVLLAKFSQRKIGPNLIGFSYVYLIGSSVLMIISMIILQFVMGRSNTNGVPGAWTDESIRYELGSGGGWFLVLTIIKTIISYVMIKILVQEQLEKSSVSNTSYNEETQSESSTITSNYQPISSSMNHNTDKGDLLYQKVGVSIENIKNEKYCVIKPLEISGDLSYKVACIVLYKKFFQVFFSQKDVNEFDAEWKKKVFIKDSDINEIDIEYFAKHSHIKNRIQNVLFTEDRLVFYINSKKIPKASINKSLLSNDAIDFINEYYINYSLAKNEDEKNHDVGEEEFIKKFMDMFGYNPNYLPKPVDLCIATAENGEKVTVNMNTIDAQTLIYIDNPTINTKSSDILLSAYNNAERDKFDFDRFNKSFLTEEDILYVEYKNDSENIDMSNGASTLGVMAHEALFGTAAALNYANKKNMPMNLTIDKSVYVIHIDKEKYGFSSIVIKMFNSLTKGEFKQYFLNLVHVKTYNNYMIELTKNLQTNNVVDDNKTDKFEEIKKYKDLFDNGIITEEEFKKKKNELLGL